MQQTVENPNANLPVLPALTPDNVTAPLPDITESNGPVPMVAQCSGWNLVNQWIAQNPQMATAILLVAAILVWPKGRR